MAGPAAHLHVLVTANTSSATRGLAQVDGQLKRTTASAQRTSNQFKTFAKGAAAGFGIGTAAVAVSKGTQAFIGFDKQMRNVNSIARLSEKNFQRLEKQVLALAGPTAQSPETLSKGLYQLVSSGFDARDALVVLRKSAIAATAGVTDTGTAATVVAAVLNAYSLKASDAGHVSDVLFKTVERGVLTFEELAQQIGTVLPGARALGVPFEQVAAAMATLTKQGFPAAEAATGVTAAIRQLSKPSEALKKTFQELGVTTGEDLVRKYGSFQAALKAVRDTTDGTSTSFRKLFIEQRGGQAGLALTGNAARKTAGDLKVIGDRAAVAGAAQKAFREQSKSLSVQLQKLDAQFQVFAVQLGTVLVPVLRVALTVLIAWDKLLLKLPKLWIAVATAAVEAGAAIVRAIRKPVGDALSFILRRMGDMFALAGRLPVVGDKFDGLAEDARHLAGQIDNWGDKTEQSTKASRKAAGVVDSLKDAASRLAGQLGETSGKTRNLRNEIDRLPSKKQIKVLVDIGFAGLDAGKSLIGGGGGDGWGVGKAIDADVSARAKKAGPGGLLGAGVQGAFNLMGASPILAPFAALGTRFGLSVTSGLRPGSITSSGNVSYHASGHAIDVNAGSAAGMLSYAKAMASLFGGRLKELIHTPLGFSIKDGQRVAPYATADHYDHVHVAMQRGGFINAGKPSGDSVPAMLERGEGVINRNAVAALGGPGAIRAINSMVPRFQTGGVVPPLGKVMGRGQARSFIHSVWDQAKSLGGKGFSEGPPPITFGKDLGGPTGMVHNGRVFFGKGFLRALAGLPNSLVADLTDKEGNLLDSHHGRNFALNTIVHEIAHSAQNLKKLSVWEREGGAESFTQWAAPKIYGALGVSDYERTPPSYPNYVHRVRGDKSQDWIHHAQFLQKGGVVGKGSNLLAGLDKVFPAHYLGQPGKQLSSDQVRAVAEKWGGLSPARALQADQITLGESSRHPGIIGQDPGGTLGIGLWQITRGVQGALGKSWIDSRGGDTGMRNPRKNAEVMSIMSGKGSSWSNWYGTSFLGSLQQNVQSVFGKGGAAGTTGKTPVKTKQKKLRSIFTKLRGVEMPSLLGPSAKTLNKRIKGLTDLAAIAAEMASRAERIGANVGGRSQTDWLNQQLGHLFALRNTLIDAEGIVERKRDAYTKAIAQAEKRLGRIHDQIEKAAKERRSAIHELNQEKGKKKPNKRRMRDLRKRIATIDSNQLSRVAERKALNAGIPEFVKGRKTLNTKRGELLTNLVDVQGVGSPMVRMNTLPAVGVLGGQILDVQQLLADAAQRITDTSPVATDTSDNSGLLELLRQANQRTAVSQRQYDVFKNFDKTSGFMGAFAKGGVALVGERGPELAHLPSGTRVHSASDTQSMLAPNVSVHVYEGEGRAEVFIDDRRIDASVERVTRRQSRNAGRRLPGRGGGG